MRKDLKDNPLIREARDIYCLPDSILALFEDGCVEFPWRGFAFAERIGTSCESFSHNVWRIECIG
jgi:hypothetical protein